MGMVYVRQPMQSSQGIEIIETKTLSAQASDAYSGIDIAITLEPDYIPISFSYETTRAYFMNYKYNSSTRTFWGSFTQVAYDEMGYATLYVTAAKIKLNIKNNGNGTGG